MKARAGFIAILFLLAGCSEAMEAEPLTQPPSPSPTPTRAFRKASPAKPAAEPEPSPAQLDQKYRRVVSEARSAMQAPQLDSLSLQTIVDLDASAQAAMAEVLRDEGRRASPVAIKAAVAALAELSDYLSGLPR